MKLRLLVIHKALAPYRIDLFNALNERFDCRFWFEYDVAREQSFRVKEIDARRSFSYEILPPGALGIANLRTSVVGIVRDFRPDIILCSEFNLITPLLVIAKNLFCQSARLVSLCDDNEQMALRQVRGTNAKSLLLNVADGVVCCDPRTAKLYADRYVHAERFHYLPIIQDEWVLRTAMERTLSRSVSLREKLSDGNSKTKLLLFVGRLVPEKNLPSLLRILPDLMGSNPHLRMVMVGDGPEESALRRLISQYGIEDRVRLEGKHEGDDLMTYYVAADCFILPSIIERFGAVANEALVAGLRICCSDAAGISPMIGDAQGTVFDPLDGSDFAKALCIEAERIAAFSSNSEPALRPSLMPITFRQAVDSFCNYLILLKR